MKLRGAEWIAGWLLGIFLLLAVLVVGRSVPSAASMRAAYEKCVAWQVVHFRNTNQPHEFWYRKAYRQSHRVCQSGNDNWDDAFPLVDYPNERIKVLVEKFHMVAEQREESRLARRYPERSNLAQRRDKVGKRLAR
jgi:hypothetical protein